MLQMLALLKGYDLDKLDPAGPDYLHTWIEAAKLAYADREAFYGDPDIRQRADGDAALGRLQRRPPQADRSGPRLARAAPRHGSRPRRRVRVRDGAGKSVAGVGEPTTSGVHTGHGADDLSVDRRGLTRGDTCHIDIIDRHGNMFTATPSGGWLQSSPVIPALGFPLGSRMQMFYLEDGHPSALAPGKRPRSTLSVGMAARDGKPYIVLGHARRRPAGPVERAAVPAPRASRHEPAGGDRRAVLAHRALPQLVLAARRPPRRGRASRAACRRRRSRNCAAAATSSRSAATGAKAACRPSRRTAAASRPPPTHAACRGMRSGGRRGQA